MWQLMSKMNIQRFGWWRNKGAMGRDDLLDRTQARVLEIFWIQNRLVS